MSSEQSEDKQFEQFKFAFFKCVTEVLQLFVDKLHTIELNKVEKQMAEVWGSSVVHKWFMDIQRPILHEGNISKMNIATCYTVLLYACGLEPPDSEVWTETGVCGNSLEYLITVMLSQLIGVAYSKDYFDNIQQNEYWDKLIETLNEILGVLVDDSNYTDFDLDLSALLQHWSVRGEINEEIDLSENMTALDFIVRREIFEDLKSVDSSFLYFCPNKLFSKFKISHLNTDELISYNDIFDWKDKDGQFPQIYVMCGQRAVGKSFYMKYVFQQFGSDNASFIGIDKFDLLIFVESSNNSSYCLVEYIDSSLQNTIQKLNLPNSEIQEIMLRGNLLVMMDSFDVATPETNNLLEEITKFSTNITLLIATRSNCLKDLCEKLPKNKKTLILYPEANTSKSVDNEGQEQMAESEGVTASCTIPLEIPPGYETSTVSKVLMDVNQLAKELSKCEIVTINDENPRDKKKPSARTIKNAASKLKILIEHLCTATAQLSNYESDEKCKLQEIIDEYEELHKEADALNKKLPPGMRTELYKSGESIFWGILYWFERLCGELQISRKMLDEMDSNYSKVKNHLHPKPKLNISPDREKPNYELVMDSMTTLSDLLFKAKEAVTMIKKNEGRTDQATKNMLLELVIDIRNLRERCDSFNASLPKVTMYNYLVYKKYVGLFAGLDYFLWELTEELRQGEGCSIADGLVQQLDEADKKIRNHLLNPEPIQPTLVKSWRPDVMSTNKKKNKAKKTKVKKKCKTGW